MVDANDMDDDMARRKREMEDAAKKRKFFKVQNANDWMKEANDAKPSQMLFGELWYEGELCILFADTNLGKSILAVQIANSISSGQPIPPFKLEAEARKVLYFDFELTKVQFKNRYSDENHTMYEFSREFDRGEINPEMIIPDEFSTFEEYLNFALEDAITEYQADVLIIDNLTYLRNETERAKDALPLMKELKRLKDKHQVSILALAHTPKRDMSKPLTINDLGGSKMLMNFCDSAFAIGASHRSKGVRFIKQIKQRNTEQIYGADNVALFTIEKHNRFLQFIFKGFGSEWQHLKGDKDAISEELREKILELHEKGMSQRKIADDTGVSVATVNRVIRKK